MSSFPSSLKTKAATATELNSGCSCRYVFKGILKASSEGDEVKGVGYHRYMRNNETDPESIVDIQLERTPGVLI